MVIGCRQNLSFVGNCLQILAGKGVAIMSKGLTHG